MRPPFVQSSAFASVRLRIQINRLHPIKLFMMIGIIAAEIRPFPFSLSLSRSGAVHQRRYRKFNFLPARLF